jgi:hypothetical protein
MRVLGEGDFEGGIMKIAFDRNWELSTEHPLAKAGEPILVYRPKRRAYQMTDTVRVDTRLCREVGVSPEWTAAEAVVYLAETRLGDREMSEEELSVIQTCG